MERQISLNKLRNGYLIRASVVGQGPDGKEVEIPELFVIRKHSGEPNPLDRVLTLQNSSRKDIEVPAVDVLDGIHHGLHGNLRFYRTLSLSELEKEKPEVGK